MWKCVKGLSDPIFTVTQSYTYTCFTPTSLVTRSWTLKKQLHHASSVHSVWTQTFINQWALYSYRKTTTVLFEPVFISPVGIQRRSIWDNICSSINHYRKSCWNISIRAIKQSSGCAAVRLRCDRRSHSSVVVRRSVSVCSCVCLFKIKNKDFPGVLHCVSCQLHLRRFSYKNKPKLVNSCHPLRVKRHKKDVEFNVELNSMYFHIYFQWTLTKREDNLHKETVQPMTFMSSVEHERCFKEH